MRITIALAAAAALVTASAAPAEGHHWHHHHDHVDGGDLVAGAVLVGGIAAIASAISQGNKQKQDAAVDGCANEAESRTGGRVGEIRHVGKDRGYYVVEGWLEPGGPGPRLSFACTIRNGSIYSFRADPLDL